jgi:hypothetical protein
MPSKRRRARESEEEEEAAGPAPPAPAAAPHGVACEPLDDAADAAAQEADQDVVELNAAADALDSLSESSEDSAARSVSMPEAAPGQATPMAGDPYAAMGMDPAAGRGLGGGAPWWLTAPTGAAAPSSARMERVVRELLSSPEAMRALEAFGGLLMQVQRVTVPPAALPGPAAEEEAAVARQASGQIAAAVAALHSVVTPGVARHVAKHILDFVGPENGFGGGLQEIDRQRWRSSVGEVHGSEILGETASASSGSLTHFAENFRAMGFSNAPTELQSDWQACSPRLTGVRSRARSMEASNEENKKRGQKKKQVSSCLASKSFLT